MMALGNRAGPLSRNSIIPADVVLYLLSLKPLERQIFISGDATYTCNFQDILPLDEESIEFYTFSLGCPYGRNY